MKNTETEKIVGGGKAYSSPELHVIDVQAEVGFCQSQSGIGRTENLYEEDGAFEWE